MMDFDQWVCNCNGNGCRWKINGSIQSIDFVDPVTQCAGLQGVRGGHDKSWAWVDGRRSLSTLASEVTHWDLHNICYDPTVASGVYSIRYTPMPMISAWRKLLAQERTATLSNLMTEHLYVSLARGQVLLKTEQFMFNLLPNRVV